MKRIVLLLILIFVSACARATTANYETMLNSWLYSNIDDLIASWGYPADSFIGPNGNKVYVYYRSTDYTRPKTYRTTINYYDIGDRTYGTATTNAYGGETITYWCKTFFEVNSSNLITNWRWEGNSCKSRYKPQTHPEHAKTRIQSQQGEQVAQVFNKQNGMGKVNECDEQRAIQTYNMKYGGTETDRYTYKNHYNSKLKKCFIYVRRTELASNREDILAVAEDKFYGEFRISKGTVVCVIKGRSCKSEEEWKSFVKEIMEE